MENEKRDFCCMWWLIFCCKPLGLDYFVVLLLVILWNGGGVRTLSVVALYIAWSSSILLVDILLFSSPDTIIAACIEAGAFLVISSSENRRSLFKAEGIELFVINWLALLLLLFVNPSSKDVSRLVMLLFSPRESEDDPKDKLPSWAAMSGLKERKCC